MPVDIKPWRVRRFDPANDKRYRHITIAMDITQWKSRTHYFCHYGNACEIRCSKLRLVFHFTFFVLHASTTLIDLFLYVHFVLVEAFIALFF